MYYVSMSKVKAASSWTFLSNHGHILIHLHNHPDSLVREIADEVGITERSALSILSDLEEGGYISVESWTKESLPNQLAKEFSPSDRGPKAT
jgi:DNA-binding MarR family transcriptional regulator